MKSLKISLLLFIACVTFVYNELRAQRQPDLSLVHYWGKNAATIAPIKQKDDVLIGGAQAYYLQWRIVNNGATSVDTIAVSDTINIKTFYGKTYQIVWGQNGFTNGMSQNDTVFIEPEVNPFIFPLGNQAVSQDSVFTNWCDSIYIVAGDLANPAVDPDNGNDRTCDSVFVTYWATDIAAAMSTESFTLYPNPSNGKLYMKSDFLIGASRIEIIDVLGRVVFTQRFESVQNLQPYCFDVAEIEGGTYLFRLISNDKIAAKKITISH